MKEVRLVLVGFGVVGQGFAELLASKQQYLQTQYGVNLSLVGVANTRHGFIYREEGLNVPTLLELARLRRPLSDHPNVERWSTTLQGLRTVSADILVEVTPTNINDAEPAISHIRTALKKSMHVVTANKGPGALAAQELFALAKEQGVQLRMEAAVMAGTPVISTIREGLAGATIVSLRGILNGTTNYILSAMSEGKDYAEVLTDAQAKGYAETDPTADVEGFDAVAKTLILAALAFNTPLQPEQVERQGITGVTREQVRDALNSGKRIKLIASLRRMPGATRSESRLEASVKPVALPLTDTLAHVNGTMNALSISTDTLSEVTITGPGAGRIETAQGLLADVLAVAR